MRFATDGDNFVFLDLGFDGFVAAKWCEEEELTEALILENLFKVSERVYGNRVSLAFMNSPYADFTANLY